MAGEGHSPGVHLGHGLQGRHVKVLATSAAAALHEGHQDGVYTQDPQGVTGQGAWRQQGRLLRYTRESQPAGQAKDHVIGGLHVSVGAGLAKIGERCDHELRVGGGQVLGANPQAGQVTRRR